MPEVPVESELYEFERIEKSLAIILGNVCNVPINTRWTAAVSDTPRVELVFRTGAPVRRTNIYALENSFAPAQPFNTYLYELDASIVTTRPQDNARHVSLIGKVRWALSYRFLVGSPGHASPLTVEISPYHTITSIDELVQTDSVDDEKSTQTAKITFRGMINIRDEAWPPAQTTSSLLLIDGTDFLLIDGTALELVA